MISIILTIHNQEKLLPITVTSLFTKSSKNVTEYIFVLDGCTDKSKFVLKDIIQKSIPTHCVYHIIETPNVFETKANNAGLKLATNPYAILVQDDMQIMEQHWDLRLIFPFQKCDDLWAVTARNALNLTPNCDYIDHVGGPVGHLRGTMKNYPRNQLLIRCYVNRGPLAFDMKKLKEVGFFKEDLPGLQAFDDAELCYRVLRLHPTWRCGAYWIDYYSPLNWGKTRSSSQHSKRMAEEEQKNQRYVISEYKNEITKYRICETRYL